MAFEIGKNNYVGFFNPDSCTVVKFRPWIAFLNNHSLIRVAISQSCKLKLDPLRHIFSTAEVSNDERSFSFVIGDTRYVVNEDVINQVLNFPTDNFDELPTSEVLTQFFTDIRYQGVVNLANLNKRELVSEWEIIFDTLAKVFANCTKNNFYRITQNLQYIGYAIAYSRKINIGKLIFHTLKLRLNAAKVDFGNNKKVCGFYPRFLMLIFNAIVSAEHQAFYSNSPTSNPPTTSKVFYSNLSKENRYPDIPVYITPYMSTFIDLPDVILPLPEPPVTQTEPQVDTSTTAEGSGGRQVIDQVSANLSTSSLTEPFLTVESQVDPSQVEVRADHEAVEPQSLTQVIEPNTTVSKTLPRTRTKQRVKRKVFEGTVSESEPAALSRSFFRKKRRTLSETTVSPSVSSQQDIDLEMAIKQSLDSSSQQGESIEIRHRAMAPCIESSTPLEPITEGTWEDPMIDVDFDIQDTMTESEHMPLVTVPAIVTAEESSQTSEGKFDLPPSLFRSFSPLPGLTPLAPLWDFPLAAPAGESGRQLGVSTTDSTQISNSQELVVYTGDRDLRTPIAPPVTFLEEAKVISHAGTSQEAGKQIVLRDVRQTQSETQARKASETQSESQESAHTDTYTATLLGYIASLNEKVEKTEAENNNLKRQVVEKSSSSTVLQDQLSLLKNEVADLKDILVPKINSLHEIQQEKLPLIEEKLNVDGAALDGIHARFDAFDQKINARLDVFDKKLVAAKEEDHERYSIVQKRLDHINGGMSTLHDGMRHLYHMVKENRKPNTAERVFFGDFDADFPDDDDSFSEAEFPTLPEDPSTKGEKGQSTKKSTTEKGKKEATTKGEQQGKSSSRSDKGKAKIAPDDEFYHDEQGDFMDWGAYQEGDEEVEEHGPTSPKTASEIEEMKADLVIRKAGSKERSELIQQQREMLEVEKIQQQELHNIAVDTRRLAIRLKEGPEWEHARMVLSLPSHELHANATLEKHFSDLKSSSINHDEYLAALNVDVLGLTCAHDTKLGELAVYIETRSTGTLRCTRTFFNDKTLTELNVFYKMTHSATPIAELFKEKLWMLARKASPEVVLIPWAVRFVKSKSLQTVYLDDDAKLRDYPIEHLVWLEHHLMNSGVYDTRKSGAAMRIQEYAKRRFLKKYELAKNRLKGHKKIQPMMPTNVFSQSERLLDPLIVKETEEGEIDSEDEDL